MQVTLFAYSDLLLFTKEDEPGRCNVLRNPLYLQSVKLQEGKRMPQRCPGLLPACPEAHIRAARFGFCPSGGQAASHQWGI